MKLNPLATLDSPFEMPNIYSQPGALRDTKIRPLDRAHLRSMILQAANGDYNARDAISTILNKYTHAAASAFNGALRISHMLELAPARQELVFRFTLQPRGERICGLEYGIRLRAIEHSYEDVHDLLMHMFANCINELMQKHTAAKLGVDS